MKLFSVVFSLMLFSITVAAQQPDTPHKVWLDEFEMAYQISGSGKHLVLLEAGATGNMKDWSHIAKEVEKFARVIRYDRVGNGQSTQIRRHFTVEDYAEHLSRLLKTLKIQEPVVYVAHSYGGLVARMFAASYPEQIKALLLVDPSSEHDVDIVRSVDFEKGNEQIEQIKLADMAGGMPNFYLDFWSKRPMPDYPQIGDIPVTVIASIKQYETPAHLLHSDEGVAKWGRLHQKWAAQFPQGQSVLTKNSHHLIPQEEPELVIREIKKLLDRIE